MFLGIDIGTTSVKVCLRESSFQSPRSEILQTRKQSKTEAYVSTGGPERAEQDVNSILLALERTLSEFPRKLLSNVTHIAVCGQMHGCMLWKAKSLKRSYWPDFKSKGNSQTDNEGFQGISHLITWEDRRCTKEFLASLPVSEQVVPLSTGYGCASLFWLARNEPGLLHQFDKAGTVQDFLVTILCNLDSPVMSVHNAVSWGYFNMQSNNWEKSLLKEAGFPIRLLPEVRDPGFQAGRLAEEYFGIPAGTPVGVALGDFQCSVLASISCSSDAVLNVGTSSQLAVVLPAQPAYEGDLESIATSTPTIQLLPFFKGRKVATSASLTGGNSIATFVSMLNNWITSLGLELPAEDVVYKRLRDCASCNLDTSLEIVPTIWGERHTPQSTGHVTGITATNLTLGSVAAALYKGLVNNLHSMMPFEFLRKCGVQRIVGTGSVLLCNLAMQNVVQRVFRLPLVIASASDAGDASEGAILANLMETDGELTFGGKFSDFQNRMNVHETDSVQMED